MKTFRKVLVMHTREREEIVEITGEVQKALAESGVSDGLVLVFPHHTSSAVYLSDSDRNLTEDFRSILSEIVPESRDYLHDETDYKKNAAGHLKAVLSGHNLALPVTAGALDLGTFQTIYYFEFDGRRDKELIIKIIGE
jgi:secondary thiamine-phosphate synthase enzyme